MLKSNSGFEPKRARGGSQRKGGKDAADSERRRAGESEFSEVDLSFLKDFTDSEETKVKKEGLIMNVILTQDLWSTLRILPRDNAPVAIMRYRGGESLSFFFELSKIYFKTKDRLNKMSVIREKYSFPSEYEEESFLGLLENKDYRIISDCVKEFEDYCHKFISRGYLEYKDNILRIRKRSDGKDAISQYYLINLLFDKNYELANAQKIIKDNYARLIWKKHLTDERKPVRLRNWLSHGNKKYFSIAPYVSE